jgi:hypothetical protein
MLKRALTLSVVLALLVLLAPPVQAAEERDNDCHMTFTLKGWSAVLKHATGEGWVTCANGQRAEVVIHANGAGLTAGKYEINDGKGRFTDVKTISDVFGTYVAASGNAGLVKSGEAMALTKGNVSLALAGHGNGFDLGVAIEKFTIKPARPRR